MDNETNLWPLLTHSWAKLWSYFDCNRTHFILPLAAPKIISPNVTDAVVRALPGYSLPYSVTGTLRIYTAVIMNSKVLLNSTYVRRIKFYEEGNYSCVATNMFGTDMITFSVKITGKTFFCKFPKHWEIAYSLPFQSQAISISRKKRANSVFCWTTMMERYMRVKQSTLQIKVSCLGMYKDCSLVLLDFF